MYLGVVGMGIGDGVVRFIGMKYFYLNQMIQTNDRITNKLQILRLMVKSNANKNVRDEDQNGWV